MSQKSSLPQAAKSVSQVLMSDTRLRKAVSDLTLDKLILKEAARGNF